MDFAMHYTEEQERFRTEVRTWLKENIPAEMTRPVDPDDRTEEMVKFWRETHKTLGAKGWLYPTYPKEYGGGGLSEDYDSILQEEFQTYGVIGHFHNGLIHNSLLVWGTEEQKQKFLAPMLRGEVSAWQKYSEPQSGADLANYQSTAVRDGDDWLLTGSNQFCSGEGRPDWLFGPMRTDDDAPRHRNMGFFMIPFPTPGLEIENQKMANNGQQHFIYLNNVRVPGDHLLGGDHQGWQVANTILEAEHGGRGAAFFSDEVVNSVVTFMQEHRTKGESPGDNPVVQQAAAAAIIDAHIHDLMQKRTFWMYTAGTEMSWEGPATGLFNREYALRNSMRTRDIFGIYGQVGSKDPYAPQGGVQEVEQRIRFIRQHGAGTKNIAKVILARRIGISRTKERAAVTPATAGAAATSESSS